MADKKDTKKKSSHQSGGAEIGLGTIILLFFLGLFILWVATGSKKTNNSNQLFDSTPIAQPVSSSDYAPN